MRKVNLSATIITAACLFMAPCVGGTMCVGADGENPGTCKKIDELYTEDTGAACDAQNGILCVDGAYCAVESIGMEGATWICTGPSTAGGDCRASAPDSCPSGTYCTVSMADLMTGDFEGMCANRGYRPTL